MKKSNHDLQYHIKRAIESTTPDVLPEVLHKIEKEKGEYKNMTNSILENEKTTPLYKSKQVHKTKTSKKFIKSIASIAAALAIVFAANLSIVYYTPESIISLDVNPSIEIKVNSSEKVLDIKALNEDAEIILSDMNFKNVDLKIAVNAIIGSMVKNGYISEIKNSILISVDSTNTDKGTKLQETLSNEVNTLLDNYAVNASVISQSISEDERIKLLSQQYNISFGKAALIDLIVSDDSTLSFDELAKLSINDINSLISAKQSSIENIANIPSENIKSSNFISEENAKSIAISHSGIDKNTVHSIKIELDYDNGKLIYEVEFFNGLVEYDYDIDAIDGTIIKYDYENKNHDNKSVPMINFSNLIDINTAKSIALNNSGLKESDVNFVKNKLYNKNNIAIYDIEFITSTNKYSYKINASTKNIISNYLKTFTNSYTDTNKYNGNNIQTNNTNNTSEYISNEKAKEIALTHAGVSENGLRKFEIKQDTKKGIVVYEIDFKHGIMEYEYKINAITGDIIDWESDVD